MTDDHQTSVFMNANGETNDNHADTASGGRLLSTSGEDKGPRIRMTRPSKFRTKAILVIFLVIVVVIAIILVVALTASSSPTSTHPFHDDVTATVLTHHHIRCKHDLMIAQEGETGNTHWRNYDSSTHVWKSIPNVKHTGFVIISPKYELQPGYPGIQVSMLLPHNSSELYIMAVTSSLRHSKVVKMIPGSSRCNSVILEDNEFFDGNGTTFRVYIFYRRHVILRGAKFTVTSLPLAVKFRSFQLEAEETINPKFVHVKPGDHDKCSVEIDNGKVQCNWLNIEDGDNANFEAVSSHSCISSGVQSTESATWFFSLTSKNTHHEYRALMVSPVIERSSKTPSILLTLWYIFKCEDTHIKIHLVPLTKTHRNLIGTSSVVAEITDPANHNDWKFTSFQILLPEDHEQYQIVLEGIVMSEGNCTEYVCTSDGYQYGRLRQPKVPMIGLDAITVELMHEQCEATSKPNVMDCKFQTEGDTGTLCEWESSLPEMYRGIPGIFEANFWQDWKAVNSGEEDDHGATSQHFVGRGHIMSFDASGRSKSQSYVRTPLLKASKNCSCVMSFMYLMRGILTPRMQVNLIFGSDVNDNTRSLEPQWSLLGHQSEHWETAVVSINLRKDLPFQIELRVLDVFDGRGDVHFDDMYFTGCDMDKYDSTSE
ncbi:uncharacterized protein LOC120326924 [Styela clava]